jgi:hypothetical protein
MRDCKLLVNYLSNYDGRINGENYGFRNGPRKRVKSFDTQPRLILNSLFLYIYSAAQIREVLYWFPSRAVG